MFETAAPLVQVIGRTLLVYAAVVVGLRLVGKRHLGQMSLPDLVVVLLIANAVQNAMVGADVSVEAGLLSAGTLLAANLLVTRLVLRSGRAQRLLEGVPTILIKDGRYVEANLRREGVEMSELGSVLREHGLEDASGVRIAYLEPDGVVSVVPMGSPVVRSRKIGRRDAGA